MRDSGYACEASQVLITNGGKHAVYNCFEALLNPGDEVLLPTPYWTTYPEPVALAGGVTVPIITTAEGGFRHRRATRSRPNGEHQGARLRVAVEPDGRDLPPRRDRGDRPLGGRARHLGDLRRDLRTPRLRRQRALLNGHARPRTRRQGHHLERRRQDLRDDRLACRLDDRSR